MRAQKRVGGWPRRPSQYCCVHIQTSEERPGERVGDLNFYYYCLFYGLILWRYHLFFLTMYFGLPRYIPPRLLGETEVRKHWSTKYFINSHWYITLHYNIIYITWTLHPSSLCVWVEIVLVCLFGVQFRQFMYRLCEIQNGKVIYVCLNFGIFPLDCRSAWWNSVFLLHKYWYLCSAGAG